jgi:regulator of cell morphogenesis and NO signaling
MQITTENIIRDIAVESPATIPVFEKFGIDYCCGGKRSLAQACKDLQLSVDQVIEKLDEVTAVPADDGTKWPAQPLYKVIQHVVRTHHTYVRQEVPRLRALAEKVRSRHGASHPELAEIESVFNELSDELLTHMMKEEQVLFPYIAKVEHSVGLGEIAPSAPFGSVERPIDAMVDDHELAGSLAARLRTLTSGYTAPMGACPSYKGLFFGLQEFERDLHAHVHLENNILFPRTLVLTGPGATGVEA